MFYSPMKTTTSWTYSSAGRAWWSPSAVPSSVWVQSLRLLFSPSSSSCQLRRWHLWWSKWTSTCWSWLSIGMGDPSAHPSQNCSAATTEICRRIQSCNDWCLLIFVTHIMLNCIHNPEFWTRLAINVMIYKVCSLNIVICDYIIKNTECYFLFLFFF